MGVSSFDRWPAFVLGHLAMRAAASPTAPAFEVREAARLAASPLPDPDQAVGAILRAAAGHPVQAVDEGSSALRAASRRWATIMRTFHGRSVGTVDPIAIQPGSTKADSFSDLSNAAYQALNADRPLFEVQVGIVNAGQGAIGSVLPWLGSALARTDLLPELGSRSAWIEAYERAVIAEANEALLRLDALEAQLAAWRSALPSGRSTSRLGDALQLILGEPFVTAAELARVLGVGRWAASMHVRTLLEHGVLDIVDDRPKGRAFVLADLPRPAERQLASDIMSGGMQARARKLDAQDRNRDDALGSAVADAVARAHAVLGVEGSDDGGSAPD